MKMGKKTFKIPRKIFITGELSAGLLKTKTMLEFINKKQTIAE